MTIDERLEALTMNRELALHEGEEQRKRIDAVSENIDRLVGSVEKLFDTVAKLAGIVESHERRLTNLEGSA